MPTKAENLKTAEPQNDPKGVRIDGYFGLALLRPGAGKLVQRSGEPQFCGSVAFRVFGFEEGPKKIRGQVLIGDDGQPRIGRRYSGEFMCVNFEGKRMYASDGYLPPSIDRSAKARIERGEIVSFAGDAWCEPAENTPLGYAYTVYDRRPRGAADPLMALASEAGIIEPLALPSPTGPIGGSQEIDPETGEIVETRAEAAE